VKRVLCPILPIPGTNAPLPQSEGEHLTRVLRLKDGDRIIAIDGKGKQVQAALRQRSGQVELEALEAPTAEAQSSVLPITLEMAVLKGDAMEWVVEKAVELGIQTIIPVLTAHTVVQTKNKGPEVFRERWQKIADQALKQCGRLDAMRVELPIPLERLLSEQPAKATAPRLWCDEAARENAGDLLTWVRQHPATQFRLLIGPEGGWSQNERDLLARSSKMEPIHTVSLGPLVLRAETAAIFGISVIAASLRSS